MKLRDQRDMHGPDTVEGQREHWAWFLAERRGGLAPIVDFRKVDAYVSGGRWVADCPACNGGIACWDENPHGCCLTCGRVYTVVFPAKHDEAATVLLARPDEHTRNWHPHRGETISDLQRENVKGRST